MKLHSVSLNRCRTVFSLELAMPGPPEAELEPSNDLAAWGGVGWVLELSSCVLSLGCNTRLHNDLKWDS